MTSSININLHCVLGDPLTVFGIDNNNSCATNNLSLLRKRYYELSLICHPDKGGSKDDMIALQQLYHMARSGLENICLSEEQIEELRSRPVYCFNDIANECAQDELSSGQEHKGTLNHEEFMSTVQNDMSYVGCMIAGAPPPFGDTNYDDTKMNDNNEPDQICGADHGGRPRDASSYSDDASETTLGIRPLEKKDLLVNYSEHKGSMDDYAVDAPLQMGDMCNAFVILPPKDDYFKEERTYEDIIKQREEFDAHVQSGQHDIKHQSIEKDMMGLILASK